MPAAFVSHGAPLVILQKDRGAAWRAWAESMPEPRGVLVVSAHWETDDLQLGAAETLDLIYDFFGFPEQLYQTRYPAPGAPDLRDRVAELLANFAPSRGKGANGNGAGSGVQIEAGRGWDHGVWTPLYFMYPNADVPVLQLSLPRAFAPADLLELGARLAPLRDEGILILGSGSLTHNLRAVNFREKDASPPAWARDFDDWCAERASSGDFAALGRAMSEAPAFQENHPTPEHYLPLLIAAGAAGEQDSVRFPLEGFEFEVLSVRCMQFG